MDQHNNIDDTNLKGIPKQHPFGTESDYFSKLNERIIDRVNEFEELKDMAPTLNQIPKYNPFSVPADYFESFPTEVQNKIAAHKTATKWTDWLVLLFKPSFSVPVLSVLLITFVGIKNIDKMGGQNAVVQDTYSIYDELEHIEESMLIDEVVNNADDQVTDDSEIEEYLIENEIEELN
ncbi:MAG: hypothetical protein JNL24_15035 [Bacteroidia bacterium]|nr:hypothetical protein [Bacteroidia bacterium]